MLSTESWADKLIEVQHISDRILLLKLIIGMTVFTHLSMHAPQANLPGADTEDYYNQLQYPFAKVPTIEILLPVGDWKGYVGYATDAVSDAHSKHLSPEFLWERQLWQHVVRASK